MKIISELGFRISDFFETVGCVSKSEIRHAKSQIAFTRLRLAAKRGIVLLCGVCWSSTGAWLPADERPTAAVSGESVIRATAGRSEIVITTTSRLAGAIHSLTWGGREFIDSADHGRQLQSAANFDAGKPFFPEVFNPTEAGSRADGAGQKSTSRLLKIKVGGRELETSTQMGFWLVPGEESEGHPAYNDRALSNHVLTKRVRIGYKNLPQAIEYVTTFKVPADEPHTFAQFEALTGYMPPEFEKFWTFDAVSGKLSPLDDGPGEQPKPVVLATADEQFAMGIIAPEQPPAGSVGPGYGRFRFTAEKVVKWNCVYRVRNANGVAPGEYRYRMFVAVGSLADVREMLASLAAEFRERD